MKNLLSILMMMMMASCGAEHVEHVEVKNYILSTHEKDEKVKAKIEEMVNLFNEEAGSQYLIWTNDASKANSFINLDDVEKEIGNNIKGLGRYHIKKNESYNHVLNVKTSTDKITSRYSMTIRLDRAYFMQNMADNKFAHERLRNLIFHEIGHGLTFDHIESDHNDVMHPMVSYNSKRNYDEFFAKVRGFFND